MQSPELVPDKSTKRRKVTITKQLIAFMDVNDQNLSQSCKIVKKKRQSKHIRNT